MKTVASFLVLAAVVAQGACSGKRTGVGGQGAGGASGGAAGTAGGSAGAEPGGKGGGGGSGPGSGGAGGATAGTFAEAGMADGGEDTAGTAGAGGSAGRNGGAAGASAGAGGAAGSSGAAAAAGTSGSAGSGGTTGAAGSAGTAGAAGTLGQVAFRRESYRAGRGTTSVPVAPVIEGQDCLFLAQIFNTTTATSNAEALGFERVTSSVIEASLTIVLHVFWKVAEGPAGQGTKEPPEFVVTNSIDTYQDLMLIAVTGCDPAAPVAATEIAGGDTAEMSVPSINAVRPGSLGLWWKGGFGSGTATMPTGWSPIVRGQDGVNDIAWRNLKVGPSGAVSAVQQLASPWALVLAAVQPP